MCFNLKQHFSFKLKMDILRAPLEKERFLIKAIEAGNIKYVISALKDDKIIKNMDTELLLMIAIKNNSLSVLKLLLSNNNIHPNENGAELIFAAKNADINIVSYLLNNKKYIGAISDDLEMIVNKSLIESVKKERIDVARLIIDEALDNEIKLDNVIKYTVFNEQGYMLSTLLRYDFNDSIKEINENIIIAAKNNNESILSTLLFDIRANPSIKNNEAIKISLKKQGEKDEFTLVTYDLFLDDRVSNEGLTNDIRNKKIETLESLTWNLKRFSFQSDENIFEFIGKSFKNIWQARYETMLIVKKNKRFDFFEKKILKNPIFKKFFLMDDKILINELRKKDVPKFKYLTHTSAALLLTYLEGNDFLAYDLARRLLPTVEHKIIEKMYPVMDD